MMVEERSIDTLEPYAYSVDMYDGEHEQCVVYCMKVRMYYGSVCMMVMNGQTIPKGVMAGLNSALSCTVG